MLVGQFLLRNGSKQDMNKYTERLGLLRRETVYSLAGLA